MRALASGLCAAAILGGCAHYEPAPLAPALIASDRDTRTINNDAVREELTRLAPKYEWRGEWNMLSLFAAAIVSNPDLAASRANLQSANAEARASRVRPGPTLTLTAEYAFNPAEASPWLLSAAGDMLIDVGGRRKARLEAADAATRLAAFDYAAALWSVRMTIRRALIARNTACNASTIAADLVALRDRQLAAVARRVSSGEASRLDLDRVRSDAAFAAQSKAGATAELNAAELDLAAAIGVPVNALDWAGAACAIDDNGKSPPPFEINDHAHALRLRTEILKATAAYDQSEAALRAAIAAQFPEVRIGPGYAWERGLSKLPFALTLTFPSNDLGKAAIGAAELRREEAGRNLEAAVASVDAGIARARADFEAALDALTLIRTSALPVAEAFALQADRELAAGAIDRADWAASRAGFAAARLEELAALRRAAEAHASLEDAYRKPLSGPETLIAASVVQ